MPKSKKETYLQSQGEKHIMDRHYAGAPTRQIACEMGFSPALIKYICNYNATRDKVIKYIEEGKQNKIMTRIIPTRNSLNTSNSIGIDIRDKDLKFAANSIVWLTGHTSFRTSGGYIYR
jgi:hypothetical protein